MDLNFAKNEALVIWLSNSRIGLPTSSYSSLCPLRPVNFFLSGRSATYAKWNSTEQPLVTSSNRPQPTAHNQATKTSRSICTMNAMYLSSYKNLIAGATN